MLSALAASDLCRRWAPALVGIALAAAPAGSTGAQALIACVVRAAGSAAAPHEADMPRCTSVPPEVAAAAAALGRSPLVKPGARIVRLDERALEALVRDPQRSAQMHLPLVGTTALVLRGPHSPFSNEAKAAQHWRGEVLAFEGGRVAARGAAFLTWNAAGVRGEFEIGPRVFRFAPLDPRHYLVYEAEPQGLPRDHPPAAAPARASDGPLPYDDFNEPPRAPVARGGRVEPGREVRQRGTATLIVVAFGFTRGAADAIALRTTDADRRRRALFSWVEQALARANAAFAQARSGAQFVVADADRDVRELPIVERAQVSDRPPTSAWFDLEMRVGLWPATRPDAAPALCHWAAAGASVYVLVGEFGGDLAAGTDAAGKPLIEGSCGMAGKPQGTLRARDADSIAALLDDGEASHQRSGELGFAVVKRLCVEHHHTLTHELGHVLGADHDAGGASSRPLEVADGALTERFAYGVATGEGSERRLTVMAVGRSEADRRYRLPVFSQHDAGASDLGAADADNARMLRLTAPVFARRAPPQPLPGTCP